MDFFAKIFDGLSGLSAKLPSFGLRGAFIIALATIAIIGLIIGLTHIFSPAFRLKKACKKISRYLKNEDSIDDDNVSDFTADCFSISVPQMLRDTWVQYLGVRFGYPSELVCESEVFDKEVKKVGNIRANIFIAIALIFIGCFAFWSFGNMSGTEMSVVHCCGLVLSGSIYLALTIISHAQIKSTRKAFYAMQDDLDAKVNLQVEKNYSTDCSPLIELAVIIDEIIAKNLSKVIELSDEMNEYSELCEDDIQNEVEIDSSPDLEQISIEQLTEETDEIATEEFTIAETDELATEVMTADEIVIVEDEIIEEEIERIAAENIAAENIAAENIADENIADEEVLEDNAIEEIVCADDNVNATINDQKNIDETMMVDQDLVSQINEEKTVVTDDTTVIVEKVAVIDDTTVIVEKVAVIDDTTIIVEEIVVTDEEKIVTEETVVTDDTAVIDEETIVTEETVVADETSVTEEETAATVVSEEKIDILSEEIVADNEILKKTTFGNLEMTLNNMRWKI